MGVKIGVEVVTRVYYIQYYLLSERLVITTTYISVHYSYTKHDQLFGYIKRYCHKFFVLITFH